MSKIVKPIYKIYNGEDWDTYYFKTTADQIIEDSSLVFLRPESHTVNNKSFMNGDTHQGITLYASDITRNSEATTNLEEDYDSLEDTVLDHVNNNSIHLEDDGYDEFLNIVDPNGNIITRIDDTGLTVPHVSLTKGSIKAYNSYDISLPEESGILALLSNLEKYLPSNMIFVGTYAEYETAYAAGEIPVGAIVHITDDDSSGEETDETTAVLGIAKLGYMILQ